MMSYFNPVYFIKWNIMHLRIDISNGKEEDAKRYLLAMKDFALLFKHTLVPTAYNRFCWDEEEIKDECFSRSLFALN